MQNDRKEREKMILKKVENETTIKNDNKKKSLTVNVELIHLKRVLFDEQGC